METTEERFINIILRHCDSKEALRSDMLLDNLEIASIDIMDIIITTEEEFGITVNDEDLMSFTTIQSVVDYIDAKAA